MRNQFKTEGNNTKRTSSVEMVDGCETMSDALGALKNILGDKIDLVLGAGKEIHRIEKETFQSDAFRKAGFDPRFVKGDRFIFTINFADGCQVFIFSGKTSSGNPYEVMGGGGVDLRETTNVVYLFDGKQSMTEIQNDGQRTEYTGEHALPSTLLPHIRELAGYSVGTEIFEPEPVATPEARSVNLCEDSESRDLADLTGGYPGRAEYIKANPDREADAKRWVDYHVALQINGDVRADEDQEFRGREWEIHYLKHIDGLSFDGLLDETALALEKHRKGESDVSEYQMCTMYLASLFDTGKLGSFQASYSAVVFEKNGKRYEFPFYPENGGVAYSRFINICSPSPEQAGYNEEYLEACRTGLECIYSAEDFAASYEAMLRTLGYMNEEREIEYKKFVESVDMNLLISTIRSFEPSKGGRPYQLPGLDIGDLIPNRKEGPLDNMFKAFFTSWNEASPLERERMTIALGQWLGKVATRHIGTDYAEGAFILGAGLLENHELRTAFDAKAAEVFEEWGGAFDVAHDLKVSGLFQYTRNMAETLGHDQAMRWTDYIAARPEFTLDMTRGNDPTFHENGHFSGVSPERDDIRIYWHLFRRHGSILRLGAGEGYHKERAFEVI